VREKVIQFGIQELSEIELWQLILGVGNKSAPIGSLSRHLTNYLHTRVSPQLNELQKLGGIGQAKSCQILACLELARRYRPTHHTIRTVEETLAHCAHLRHAAQEHIVCFYLNNALEILKQETVAIGELNAAQLSPRTLLLPMVGLPVSTVIVAHNHPSGHTFPSSDDVRWTGRVSAACSILGIELADHMIITAKHHYSFREHYDLRELAEDLGFMCSGTSSTTSANNASSA
jgi:DNA repair protein RadC